MDDEERRSHGRLFLKGLSRLLRVLGFLAVVGTIVFLLATGLSGDLAAFGQALLVGGLLTVQFFGYAYVIALLLDMDEDVRALRKVLAPPAPPPPEAPTPEAESALPTP